MQGGQYFKNDILIRAQEVSCICKNGSPFQCFTGQYRAGIACSRILLSKQSYFPLHYFHFLGKGNEVKFFLSISYPPNRRATKEKTRYIYDQNHVSKGLVQCTRLQSLSGMGSVDVHNLNYVILCVKRSDLDWF